MNAGRFVVTPREGRRPARAGTQGQRRPAASAHESRPCPCSGSGGSVSVVAPRRVAMLSVHTSPLDQPGTGDAGGMNVYVTETARRLAARGTEVEIFTRATSSDLPPTVELSDGVLVRHVVAGPFSGLAKEDLPAQLCAFSAGLLRAEAWHDEGWYDLVHSHYW